MRDRNYLCSLDIGTSKVVAFLGEVQEDGSVEILGYGQAPSKGLIAGMVTNIEAASYSIRQAVDEAELMADRRIDSVVLGITGNHIGSVMQKALSKLKMGK